jgi:hypothetical protein
MMSKRFRHGLRKQQRKLANDYINGLIAQGWDPRDSVRRVVFDMSGVVQRRGETVEELAARSVGMTIQQFNRAMALVNAGHDVHEAEAMARAGK